MENYQKDELATGSGFDLWASTYINSGVGNYWEEQSQCFKDTHNCLQADSNLDTERHLQKCVTSKGAPLTLEKAGLVFPSLINLNMLIMQFLLICLFSLLVEFSDAFYSFMSNGKLEGI